MINTKLGKKISTIWMIALMVVFTTILAVIMVASANALTDIVSPTINSVSVLNNEKDLARGEQITVVFSEYMDSATINKDTFIVMQRTTPELGAYKSIAVDGTVTYNGRSATFTPTDLFSPNQHYGNVFTATITTGAKDLAGNSLSRDFVWSFTTGDTPFNTGATTSQSDQSANLISGSATVPVSTQPLVTTAPVIGAEVAKSNLSWIWWVVGAAFLLLVIALVSVSAINITPQKNIRTVRPSPFGDVHPVMDIEGIGPEYGKRLNSLGIKNTKQLWGADAVKVARKTGASLSSVRSWQSMAELASVKDIGPQYAELIERSGIHSIDQLKSSNTNELLRLVREKQESLKVNIQGNSIGHATVENWIEEARDHQFSHPVVGEIA